jgi:hypothetical protein
MTPEERRQAIDDICIELGWILQRFPSGNPDAWIDRDGRLVGNYDTVDPFTSPNDCARVMEEARGRDYKMSLTCIFKLWTAEVYTDVTKVRQATSNSWMEAFSLAVWEMIRG